MINKFNYYFVTLLIFGNSVQKYRGTWASLFTVLFLFIIIYFLEISVFVVTIFSTSYDVHLLINGKEPSFSSIGEFWFALSPTSLQISEAVVSRYFDPCSLFISLECDPLLWHPIISSFLLMPSTPTLILISIFLFWIYRRNIKKTISTHYS